MRDEIVEAVDLVPSILDWCGVQVPSFMQGRSFRPLLEGRPYEPRRSALIELRNTHGRGGYKAVRTTDWLYECRADGTERLFDLPEDPDQLRNVAGVSCNADALSAMRRELIDRWFDADVRHSRRTAAY
jgi:arylsulfatase A-like enzyme